MIKEKNIFALSSCYTSYTSYASYTSYTSYTPCNCVTV